MYSGLRDLGKSPDFAWIYHGESTAITRKLQMSLWGFQSSRASFSQSYRINISAYYTDLFGSFSEEEKGEKEMGGRNCSLVSWLRDPCAQLTVLILLTLCKDCFYLIFRV